MTFLYPSSIAAYGLPDLDTKAQAGRVREDDWNTPTTMYGCNKLYCEHLGRYYARHYKQLAADTPSRRVDFRCVRFPGPHLGGDRAVGRHLRLRAGDDSRRRARRARTPASSGRTRASRSWRCPTRSTALLRLAAAPRDAADADRLQPDGVQPDGGGDPRRRDAARFRGAASRWEVDAKRQAIVDSWPADVDDSAGAPRLGLRAAIRFPARVRRVSDSDDPGALHNE